MNTRTIMLAASLMFGSGLSIAADMPATGSGEKQAVTADVAKPAASAPKARKAAVPETQKDRENKKKCRGMGGTWQLGHCNVG